MKRRRERQKLQPTGGAIVRQSIEEREKKNTGKQTKKTIKLVKNQQKNSLFIEKESELNSSGESLLIKYYNV